MESVIKSGKSIFKELEVYIKNTGWLFVGRIVNLSISFFIGAYVARYLGPDQYGTLNFIISFVGIFGCLSSLGIDGIIVQRLINHTDKKDEILGTSFGMRIIGASLVIIFSTLAAAILGNSFENILFVLLYSLSFIFQPFLIIDSFYQSHTNVKPLIKIQSYTSIISAVLKLLAIVSKSHIAVFLLIFAIEQVLYGLSLVVIYRKTHGSIKMWTWNKFLAKEMFLLSWPLIFTSAFYTIYMKIDQVIVKHLLGNTATGIYSVAVRISETWYFIPTLLVSAFFPALIKSLKINICEYKKQLRRLYIACIALSIVCIIPLYIISPFVISKLFGVAYLSAIPIVKIYIWSGIAFSIMIVSTNALLAEHRTKLYAFSSLIGAVVNIILNFVFIPYYGIAGAAYATIISYAIVPIVIGIINIVKRHRV